MELLNIELPKHPIGIKFTYRYGKQSYDAEVIGYHIEHDTDTGYTNVQYRAQYNFAGLQIMKINVARSTVDRSVFATA